MVSKEYVEQRLERMRVWMRLRGLAPVTVVVYLRCARQFMRAVGKPLGSVTPKDMRTVSPNSATEGGNLRCCAPPHRTLVDCSRPHCRVWRTAHAAKNSRLGLATLDACLHRGSDARSPRTASGNCLLLWWHRGVPTHRPRGRPMLFPVEAAEPQTNQSALRAPKKLDERVQWHPNWQVAPLVLRGRRFTTRMLSAPADDGPVGVTARWRRSAPWPAAPRPSAKNRGRPTATGCPPATRPACPPGTATPARCASRWTRSTSPPP